MDKLSPLELRAVVEIFDSRSVFKNCTTLHDLLNAHNNRNEIANITFPAAETALKSFFEQAARRLKTETQTETWNSSYRAWKEAAAVKNNDDDALLTEEEAQTTSVKLFNASDDDDSGDDVDEDASPKKKKTTAKDNKNKKPSPKKKGKK